MRGLQVKNKEALGYKFEPLSTWKGKWIYVGDTHMYWNVFRRFRKTFLLPDKKIKTALIKITGDTRYILWVNGIFICRGPAKGYPWIQPYDKIDIKNYLKVGRNSLAILLHIYGVSTFSNIWRNRAGIIVDGEVVFNDGESVGLYSDETWKACYDPARSSEGQRLSIQQSFQEIFDGRKEIQDWLSPDFDDSKWQNANVLGPAGIPPWYNMEERGIPFLKEEEVPFINVIKFYTGKNHPDYKNNRCLREILYEEERRSISEGKICVHMGSNGVKTLTIYPTGLLRFSAVLLDIGKSSVGSPRLKIESNKGGEIIDLYYSMRGPDNKYFYFKPGHYCDIALLDRYICRKGTQVFEPFNFKGYRYLLLVFRNVNEVMNVSIKHNFISYPTESKGSFECSDEILNKIWKIGEWTLKCCMLDSYVDCPDREQGQWMGDALIEEEVNFYSFGDPFLIRRMIRQCAQSQIPNGLLYGVFPTERHSCILPDYNFTWLIAAEKYYFYTGDITILKEIYPVAEKNLNWFKGFAGKRYLLGNPEGYWLFLDWSTIDKSGLTASFNLWYVLALQSMQRISKILKQNPIQYSKQEEKVKESLLSTFYNKQFGFWNEAYDLKTKKLRQISQHANTLAFLANLPIGKKGEEIIKDSFLKKSTYNKPRASSYFAYYVLESLFKLGEEELALKRIRDGWGSMIQSGATTFWENWDALNNEWSVCHAWSSHPLVLLSKYVLGIKSTSVAWKTFSFKPYIGSDVKWAKGTVPTPYGSIKVEWRKDDRNKLSYNIDYPKEIRGNLIKK